MNKLHELYCLENITTQLSHIQEVFLADIKAYVLMKTSWDQSGVPLVPTDEWSMHRAGEKIIPIANSNDITAALGASLPSKYLPP